MVAPKFEQVTNKCIMHINKHWTNNSDYKSLLQQSKTPREKWYLASTMIIFLYDPPNQIEQKISELSRSFVKLFRATPTTLLPIQQTTSSTTDNKPKHMSLFSKDEKETKTHDNKKHTETETTQQQEAKNKDTQSKDSQSIDTQSKKPDDESITPDDDSVIMDTAQDDTKSDDDVKESPKIHVSEPISPIQDTTSPPPPAPPLPPPPPIQDFLQTMIKKKKDVDETLKQTKDEDEDKPDYVKAIKDFDFSKLKKVDPQEVAAAAAASKKKDVPDLADVLQSLSKLKKVDKSTILPAIKTIDPKRPSVDALLESKGRLKKVDPATLSLPPRQMDLMDSLKDKIGKKFSSITGRSPPIQTKTDSETTKRPAPEDENSQLLSDSESASDSDSSDHWEDASSGDGITQLGYGISSVVQKLKQKIIANPRHPDKVLWTAKNLLNSLPPFSQSTLNNVHKLLKPLRHHDEGLHDTSILLTHMLHQPTFHNKEIHHCSYVPTAGAINAAYNYINNDNSFEHFHDISQNIHQYMYENKTYLQNKHDQIPEKPEQDNQFISNINTLMTSIDPNINSDNTTAIDSLIAKIQTGTLNPSVMVALTSVILSMLGLNYDSVADFLEFVTNELSKTDDEKDNEQPPPQITQQSSMGSEPAYPRASKQYGRSFPHSVNQLTGAPLMPLGTRGVNNPIPTQQTPEEDNGLTYSEETLKHALLKTSLYGAKKGDPLGLYDKRNKHHRIDIKALVATMAQNPETWYQTYPHVRNALITAFKGVPEEWERSQLSGIVPIHSSDLSLPKHEPIDEIEETGIATQLNPLQDQTWGKIRESKYTPHSIPKAPRNHNVDYNQALPYNQIMATTRRFDNKIHPNTMDEDLDTNQEAAGILKHPYYSFANEYKALAPHDAPLIHKFINKREKQSVVGLPSPAHSHLPVIHLATKEGKANTALPIDKHIYPKIVRDGCIKLLTHHRSNNKKQKR